MFGLAAALGFFDEGGDFVHYEDYFFFENFPAWVWPTRSPSRSLLWTCLWLHVMGISVSWHLLRVPLLAVGMS